MILCINLSSLIHNLHLPVNDNLYLHLQVLLRKAVSTLKLDHNSQYFYALAFQRIPEYKLSTFTLSFTETMICDNMK